MKLPKIMSEQERERKEKQKKRWMTVIIIFLLMASTAAYALTSLGGETTKTRYNGFSFVQTDQGWQLKDTGLITKFLPNDVENISSPAISGEDFKNNVYFIAMSNSEQLTANELNSAFYNAIIKSQLACSEKYANESFCNDLPVKNCENETSSLIIQIEEGENQSINYKDNCLTIKGNEADLLKSADKIIFSAYGVIK